MSNQLGGKAEIAIGGILVPPSMLSEIKVSLSEGVRVRDTLGGKFSRPSGALDKAEVSFNVYLPSMGYLKDIFPERYNAPTAPQTVGNVVMNADSCVQVATGPVNIHYSCETSDANDVYLFAGLALLDFSATYNAKEDLNVGVTIYAQPDENGDVARIGTGDLTAIGHYDATTQLTVAGLET